MEHYSIKYLSSNTYASTEITVAYSYSFTEINYFKSLGSLTSSEAQKNCSEAYIGAKDIKTHRK